MPVLTITQKYLQVTEMYESEGGSLLIIYSRCHKSSISAPYFFDQTPRQPFLSLFVFCAATIWGQHLFLQKVCGYQQELMSTAKWCEGTSNYHTLVGSILCWIWHLQNEPYKVATSLHLLRLPLESIVVTNNPSTSSVILVGNYVYTCLCATYVNHL